jgi:hypothetical protein
MYASLQLLSATSLSWQILHANQSLVFEDRKKDRYPARQMLVKKEFK